MPRISDKRSFETWPTRSAAVRAFFETGMSPRQIADRMGITLSQVHVSMRYQRKAGPLFCVPLKDGARRALEQEARRRHISAPALAADLIDMLARQGGMADVLERGRG